MCARRFAIPRRPLGGTPFQKGANGGCVCGARRPRRARCFAIPRRLRRHPLSKGSKWRTCVGRGGPGAPAVLQSPAARWAAPPFKRWQMADVSVGRDDPARPPEGTKPAGSPGQRLRRIFSRRARYSSWVSSPASRRVSSCLSCPLTSRALEGISPLLWGGGGWSGLLRFQGWLAGGT